MNMPRRTAPSGYCRPRIVPGHLDRAPARLARASARIGLGSAFEAAPPDVGASADRGRAGSHALLLAKHTPIFLRALTPKAHASSRRDEIMSASALHEVQHEIARL